MLPIWKKIFINQKPYFVVNFIFVVIIGAIFFYSYFFYSSHPIQCLTKAYSGKSCSSCGFSRAFSAFTHFKFDEGKRNNIMALPCFVFLCCQFFLRVFICFGIIKNIRLINWHPFFISEVSASVLLFVYAFLPLLLY